MPNALESKRILERLVLSIIGDEENLKNFVFFFNRLENTRRPTGEIASVLKDYTGGRKDTGKESIGFIDVNKIEVIANAILNKTGIKVPISIHDFKRKYKKNILRNDEFGKSYKDLIQEYQDGDEIFEIVSSRQTWKQLCGRSGIVLKRNGKQVTGILKSMN